MSGTVLAILISFLILKEHFQFISFSLLLWDEIYNLFKTCIYTALAMICFSSYSVIDSYWAPRAGHSTLSILGYSQRILIGIGNLVVVGPSTVFVHDFALLLRDRDFRNFWQLFLKLTVSAFVVSVFVAATTAQFAEHIVYHLFSRGNFGEYEVMAVSNCLKYFAPGMAMMLLSVIILRVLFCFDGLAKNLGILGIFWTISYIIFSKYLHTLGANGIALSYSISWIIYLLFITFLIVNIYYKKIKPNL
jgi:putative peptidoglycan lipid II flippase